MECVRPAAGTEAPSGFTGQIQFGLGAHKGGLLSEHRPPRGAPSRLPGKQVPGSLGRSGKGRSRSCPPPGTIPHTHCPSPSQSTTLTAHHHHTYGCQLWSHCLRHTDPASSSLLTTLVPTASGQCPPPRENSHLCTCLDTAPAVPTSAAGSWPLGGLLRSGPGPCPSQEPLAENNSSGDCLGRGQLGQEPPRLATRPSNPPTSQARVQERRDVQKCGPVSEHFSLTGPHANELTIDSLLLGSRAQAGEKATPPHSQLWQKGGSRK